MIPNLNFIMYDLIECLHVDYYSDIWVYLFVVYGDDFKKDHCCHNNY